MTYAPKFDVDLSYGEARESAFVDALRRCRVECKSDRKAKVTGNIAVEFRQGSTKRGKGSPSGIALSESEWWATEYDDGCWLVVPTPLMKQLARRAIDVGRVKMCGDGDRFECALVPVEWLITPWRHVREGAA